MPAEEATSTTTEEQPQQQTGKEETLEEKTERAKSLYTEGKRQYLSNSFAEASKSLADACELHGAVYGDFHPSCADPYFYYGKSLLELARMEPGVFSNALEGVAEEGDSSAGEEEGEEDGVGEEKEEEELEKKEEETEDQFEDPAKLTEEEREELHEMVEDALEENAEALDKGQVCQETPPAPDESGEEKKEEAEEEGDDEEIVPDSMEEELGQEEGEGKETEGEGEKTEEDQAGEVSNLQLAWEMLDMARLICEKQEGGDWRLKLCECLVALGEVAIEDERYEKAVEDLTACISIQKDIHDNTDRRIAETYFQLGRAQNLSCEFMEAASSFKAALEVIKTRKERMEADLSEEESEETRKKLEKEIEDLSTLIPEIQGKVTDCEESQKSADERKKELEQEEAQTTTEMGFGDKETPLDTSGDKETKSIGHLVRKPLKRKPEDEDPEDPKRARADTNGVQENGLTNGHHGQEVEG